MSKSSIEFSDSWMTPSPDRTGLKKVASPGTERTERTKAKSPRLTKEVKKGLARSAVTVVKVDKFNAEVWLKGRGKLVGTIRRSKLGGISYGYRLIGDNKISSGFPTQAQCIERMLTKV